MDGWLRILSVGAAVVAALIVVQTLTAKDLLGMFLAFWALLSIGYFTSFVSTPLNYRGADEFRRPWLSVLCIFAVALLGSGAMIGARIWATVPATS